MASATTKELSVERAEKKLFVYSVQGSGFYVLEGCSLLYFVYTQDKTFFREAPFRKKVGVLNWVPF